MRDILIVLAIIVAALAIGVGFYFYGPQEFRETSNTVAQVADMEQTPPAPVRNEVRVTVLENGTNAGGAPGRKNVAAYDEDGFVRVWQLAHGTDGTPLPTVDFGTQSVIGVFSGTRSSGGHDIEVSSVVDTEDARTVTITLTKPGPGCVVTQALTSPYQIVAVPSSALPLKKVERTVETSCR